MWNSEHFVKRFFFCYFISERINKSSAEAEYLMYQAGYAIPCKILHCVNG